MIFNDIYIYIYDTEYIEEFPLDLLVYFLKLKQAREGEWEREGEREENKCTVSDCIG